MTQSQQASRPRSGVLVGAAMAVGAMLMATTTSAEQQQQPVSVKAAIACTRGPSDQTFMAAVTMPRSGTTGSYFRVRIDGVPSGPISHTGLNYIHEMTTSFLIPTGTTYVADSLRIVPGTGTPNVRAGARSWRDAAGIHEVLPAHIDNGESFTAPSLEFDVRIDAPVGSVVALQFARYEVTANVFLVGDLKTTCDPSPRPYTIGQTVVAAPASPPVAPAAPPTP